MKALYTKEEYQNTKSREYLPLQCKKCLKTFYRSKHSITSYLNPNRKENGDFCCQLCNMRFRYPAIIVECNECDIKFQKASSEIRKTKHNFCSCRCAGIYNSKHKTKGIKRSKVEKWIFEQLQHHYSELTILQNDRTTIHDELDIFITQLKLAFEINGIFHYKPIYGEEHLKHQKDIDIRKMKKCFQKGIKLFTIDIGQQLIFTPESSQIFLEKIKKQINLHLLNKNPGGEDRI